MSNADVVRVLEEIAVLLQLRGENEFRWKAYQHAAVTVGELPTALTDIVAEAKLGTVRGMGSQIGDRIKQLVTTGSMPYLDELRAATPPGLLAMIRVPGLGPKKAKALFDVLAPADLVTLETMCVDGRVAKVKGFGAKSAENVLAGVRFLRAAGDRVRYDCGLRIAVALLDPISALESVERAEVAGELRRRCEVVGDVVIVVASDDPAGVLDAVAGLAAVKRVLERGMDVIRVIAEVPYRTGTLSLPAEVRVASPAEYGVTLFRATGPVSHVAAVEARQGALAGASDEAAVYAAAGLPFVPPELRDWPDAIAVAESGAMPDLVRDSDIRGVFHNHTTASDGVGTLPEMAQAAADLGYEYFGVGDHSQSLTVANGLSPDRVKRQWAEIDEYNRGAGALRVLRGTECDILGDGSLDFADDVLAGFDYVVASVHTLFGLSVEDQTARVCGALSHPRVTMLGHATGRLLLRREGYKLDVEAVIDTAARHGKMIEINAQPDRLDLSWEHCRLAQKRGVPLVINPDAHSTTDLEKVPFGVNVARRAGLTAADVFNTRDLAAVLGELARRRAG